MGLGYAFDYEEPSPRAESSQQGMCSTADNNHLHRILTLVVCCSLRQRHSMLGWILLCLCSTELLVKMYSIRYMYSPLPIQECGADQVDLADGAHARKMQERKVELNRRAQAKFRQRKKVEPPAITHYSSLLCTLARKFALLSRMRY